MSSSFADTHNMVAILAKSDAAKGFEQIIDFLNGSYIYYALTVNPHIYASCIKQFWNTATVKHSANITRLQALVDRKKVLISEAVIREVLRLNDSEGVVCLPNEEIFIGLAQMRYEKPSSKLTFYKVFFSSQWKFLIHTILQSLSAKRTSWNEFSSTMASAVICISTSRKFNFSKYIFDSLVRNVDSSSKFYMYPMFIQLIIQNQIDDLSTHTTKYISPTLTQKVFANMKRIRKGFLGVATPLFEGMLAVREIVEEGIAEAQVQDATATATVQEDVTPVVQVDVTPVAPEDVHDEVIPSPAPPTLPPQPTYDISSNSQVGTSQRIESSADMEDVFNQGRMIADLDKDEGIELVDEQVKDTAEVEGRQTNKQAVTAATSQVSAASATIPAAKSSIPAAAPTIVPKPMKKKDQVKLDAEYARKLHEEINMYIDWDTAIDHVKQKSKEKAAKGMKLNEEAKKVEDLKKHFEIVPNEDDDVYTEATPLARKVPVVDYQIVKINNKPRYKIIKADKTHQLALCSIAAMNFNQEKEEPPQNSDIHQLVQEECGIKVCEKQKQIVEDTLLELLEVCRQKEFYCMHNDVDDLIESALNSKLLLINLRSQCLDKKKQEVKNIVISPFHAIASILPTEEPEYSLSMGYEHLSTISEMKSDEVIMSSVKNLFPILSEYEVTSDDESECDVPIKDESSPVFTTFSNPIFDDNEDFTSSDDELLYDEDVLMEDFKVYSNPLFNDEIKSDKIDPHYFNTKSDFVESLSNRDTLFNSSPKFDYLKEISNELMPTSIVNEERIKREQEEHSSLIEKLLAINSFLRLLENFHANTIVDTLPSSPILVEDGDSLREEIDIFISTDDLLPPEPPDFEFYFDFESDLGELISAVINNIDELNEDECFDPGREIN
nr:hypothetical protein [Tanacetum cinerariifolium]